MGPTHTQLWPVARITLRQGIRGCNARGREFDHIDPALAALDAGDRRLRLADTNVI